jgi:phytoene dehydrogenase-like protein
MKEVIIVGAGIAGLTAGIYALQSGFDVTVYESHTIPGGASTSWRRKGYFFEGGMHWLTGSAPEKPFYKLWREIGALAEEVSVYNRDPFFTYEYRGKTASLYRDIDKLRNHFLELAPEDKEEILALCADIKKFSKINMPLTDIKGVKVKHKAKMPVTTVLSVLPAVPRMSFYSGITAKEFSERFKNPLLRMLLENVVGPEYNATGLLFTLATFASGDGGYPAGGSLGMATRIAKNLETMGGRIIYGKPVSKVLVQEGVAKGVVVNGEQIIADAVIVTRDTLTAVDTLFDSPIQEEWALNMRKSTVPVLDTFIGVGVEADLSDLPESISFALEEPLMCGGVPVRTGGWYSRYLLCCSGQL